MSLQHKNAINVKITSVDFILFIIKVVFNWIWLHAMILWMLEDVIVKVLSLSVSAVNTVQMIF